MFCNLTYFFLFPRPLGHITPVRDISRRKAYRFAAGKISRLVRDISRSVRSISHPVRGISQRCHSAQLAIWRSQVKRRISYNQARDKGFFISLTLHSE